MNILRVLKGKIIGGIKFILNKKGFLLIDKKQYNSILHYSENLLNAYCNKRVKSDYIDSIVFSKDRAMQLFAFLKSFDEMISNKGKMTIIYKSSDERHRKSYFQLISYFDSQKYVFIEEVDFRSQLIKVCEESRESTLGLFVDDMIFLQKIDFDLINKVNPLTHIVSLSRGMDLVYSQVLNKKNILPAFKEEASGMFSYNWNSSDELNDWTYPLGVGGFFYDRIELLSIFKSIDFKAPNSLEGNMQVYLPLFINRFGLCFKKIACVCVHANIVQSEWSNPIIGTFSIEELLKKWEDGLSIDITKFYNKDGMEAKFQKYEFKMRTNF